ncbi:MAG TPA: hypothetical protein PKG88_00550 [Bacteroidales bacterium]|nr:hypothetical protein [Bacteroidales bacterium]HPS70723.1 hypothetical protein [Bacteroidales bacterium]
MNFTFFHRPDSRKFNYKPQFFVPDDEKPKRNSSEYNSDEFAERLHRSWGQRRHNKKQGISNFKSIVWIVFILFLLIFVYYKFFMK